MADSLLMSAFQGLVINDNFDKVVEYTLFRLQRIFRDVTLEEQLIGQQIYANRVKNNYTWSRADYATRSFQKVYCARIFRRQAQLAYENMLDVFQFLDYSTTFNSTKWSTLSLGCGPGSDLLGIKIALEEKFGKSSERKFFGIDAVREWQPVFNTVDSSFKFYWAHINENYIDNMSPVDVIVMSYMYYSGSYKRTYSGRPNNDKLYQQGHSIRKLDNKARRIIIVIDTTDHVQRAVFEQQGFETLLSRDSFGRPVLVHFKVKNLIPVPNQMFQRAYGQPFRQPSLIQQPRIPSQYPGHHQALGSHMFAYPVLEAPFYQRPNVVGFANPVLNTCSI